MPLLEHKGQKGLNCNRMCCQRPNAVYFNHSTRAYYCRPCAEDINRLCAGDSYVVEHLKHPLLTLDPEAELIAARREEDDEDG